jgi:hypothetical protein
MDILQTKQIYIDQFLPSDHTESDSTFLLTHLHTDHFYIPDSFCGDIYTTSPLSIVTSFLPNTCCFVIVLVYGQIYKTKKYNIPYFAFPTSHTPFSCGFIFPSLNIIYFGDGRMSTSLLKYVPTYKPSQTIIYDGLFENKKVHGTEDHTLLQSILTTLQYRAVRCVHYGILSYIKRYTKNIRFRIDYTTVPLLIQKFIHYIGLYNAESEYIIIGHNSTEYTEYILPSAMWFVVNEKDISKYHYTNKRNILRVFVSCHSIPKEIKNWKTKFQDMHTFVPVVTRPI